MSLAVATPNQTQSSDVHLETSPFHIKGILAATDYSEQATLALKIAARLAKQLRCRLHVVHSVEPQIYPAGAQGLTPILVEAEIKRAKEELHEYGLRIPELKVVKHEEIVLTGSVVQAIATLMDFKGIDLLVMGSHGRRSFGKLILGSNAEAAIRNLHCPVLVVGPNCASSFRAPKSIVFSADLHTDSIRAAQYATSIAQESGAMLTFLHVLPKHLRNKDELALLKKEALESMRQLAPKHPELKRRPRFDVVTGDRADAILDALNRHTAGLVILGAHEGGALTNHSPGTLLSQVIRSAHCPVLAVQPHI